MAVERDGVRTSLALRAVPRVAVVLLCACGVVVGMGAGCRSAGWTIQLRPSVATVACTGNTVIAVTGSDAMRVCRVVAVEPTGGTELWRRSLTTAVARSPMMLGPVIEGPYLLLCDPVGNRWVLDTSDGRILWVRYVGGQPHAPAHTGVPPAVGAIPQRPRPFRSPGTVADGRFFMCDRYLEVLECRNAPTGNLLWQRRISTDAYWLIVADSTGVYVSFDDGAVRKYAAPSGAELWEARIGKSAHKLALTGDGAVIAGGRDIAALNTADGAVLWSVIQTVSVAPSHVETLAVDAGGDRVYGVTPGASLLCLDTQTGRQVWESRPAQASCRPWSNLSVGQGISYGFLAGRGNAGHVRRLSPQGEVLSEHRGVKNGQSVAECGPGIAVVTVGAGVTYLPPAEDDSGR